MKKNIITFFVFTNTFYFISCSLRLEGKFNPDEQIMEVIDEDFYDQTTTYDYDARESDDIPLEDAIGDEIDRCEDGLTLCGNECVDLSSDVSNCGSCGNQCPSGPHSIPVCRNRICGIQCDPGWSNLDGNLENGCEIECVPSTPPEEVCDGRDNDCNGAIDDSFDCAQGSSVSCTTSCGTTGTGTCTDSCEIPSPENCTPPNEICNGIDDNCNNTCDEGFDCCAGTNQTQSCGNCGTKTLSCNSSCRWEEGACTGEGVCTPGTTQTQPCGNCGIKTLTCNSSCQWDEGPCTNEGVCSPGATQDCAIDSCNGTQTCSDSCEWQDCVIPVPSNDTCSTPQTITSGTTVNGTTCGAQNDYTFRCDDGNGRDVVYSFNVSQRSFVTLSTCGGASWDTVLNIARADTCPPSSILLCNDDYPGCWPQSGLNAVLNPGEYYVIVDGWDANSYGDFSLSFNAVPASNDQCSGAIDITSIPIILDDTTSATSDTGQSCEGSGANGVWYRFTLTQQEVVYLDTLDGNSWDSVITVKSGSCTGPNVLCNDDSCTTQRSQIAGVLDAGIYYILVSGFNASDYGPLVLRFNHSRCPGARLLNQGANSGNTTGQGADTRSSCGGNSAPDVPYYFTLCPGEHNVTLYTCGDGQDWDSVIYLRSGFGGICGSYEITCNDGGCSGGSWRRSRIDETIWGPGLLFAIVDGISGANGSYTLTASY